MLSTILNGFANWQTTTTGIITAIIYLLHSLGVVEIPKDVQTGLIAVVIFIVSFLMKDGKKTGLVDKDEFLRG